MWRRSVLTWTDERQCWETLRGLEDEMICMTGIFTIDYLVRSNLFHQTRDTDPMMVQNWASILDDGPILSQHWISVSCFLESWKLYRLFTIKHQPKHALHKDREFLHSRETWSQFKIVRNEVSAGSTEILYGNEAETLRAALTNRSKYGISPPNFNKNWITAQFKYSNMRIQIYWDRPTCKIGDFDVDR